VKLLPYSPGGVEEIRQLFTQVFSNSEGQPEGWLGQSLVGDEIEPIAGNSYCVEAFNKPEYWL
jgi:hypothetical protein